jgi:hypothetical protein
MNLSRADLAFGERGLCVRPELLRRSSMAAAQHRRDEKK